MLPRPVGARLPNGAGLESGERYGAYGLHVSNVQLSRSWKNRCLPLVSCQVKKSAPRARGDGPSASPRATSAHACSPRTRGWTRHGGHWAPSVGLLPAHAGMDPSPTTPRRAPTAAPRARGDGPGRMGSALTQSCCSPRTRGWTRPGRRSGSTQGLLPAHAGMDPWPWSGRSRCSPAPRARGDGPAKVYRRLCEELCSPRTRGWTRWCGAEGGGCWLLPAHAGMDHGVVQVVDAAEAAPRARGDGPLAYDFTVLDRNCSPRTRGWTHPPGIGVDDVGLLPAHAGMDPLAVFDRSV